MASQQRQCPNEDVDHQPTSRGSGPAQMGRLQFPQEDGSGQPGDGCPSYRLYQESGCPPAQRENQTSRKGGDYANAGNSFGKGIGECTRQPGVQGSKVENALFGREKNERPAERVEDLCLRVGLKWRTGVHEGIPQRQPSHLQRFIRVIPVRCKIEEEITTGGHSIR